MSHPNPKKEPPTCECGEILTEEEFNEHGMCTDCGYLAFK